MVSRIVIPNSLEFGLSNAGSSLLRAFPVRNKICVLVFLLSNLVLRDFSDNEDSKKMAICI